MDRIAIHENEKQNDKDTRKSRDIYFAEVFGTSLFPLPQPIKRRPLL